MPTGYTADVADGKVADFRTFALRCARAFGATVMQRDDPSNDPPKHREPSDYNAKALVKAQAELTRLASLTLADAAAEMDAELAEAEATIIRRRSERATKRARYEAMLAEVEAWEPPTPDHEEMKKFMREQITQSIDFDCGDYSRPLVKQTAAEWLAAKRVKAAKDVAYHAQHHAEEIERCAEANAWIDALYASLPDEDTEPTDAQLERMNNPDSGPTRTEDTPSYRQSMQDAGRGHLLR